MLEPLTLNPTARWAYACSHACCAPARTRATCLQRRTVCRQRMNARWAPTIMCGRPARAERWAPRTHCSAQLPIGYMLLACHTVKNAGPACARYAAPRRPGKAAYFLRHTMAWLQPHWNLRRCSLMTKGTSFCSTSVKSPAGTGAGGGELGWGRRDVQTRRHWELDRQWFPLHQHVRCTNKAGSKPS